MTRYDDTFFDYVNSGAVTSARELLPELLRVIPIGSVLDVGCGQGAWLSVWRELGVTDIQGIDGSYVDCNNLLVPEQCFRAHDLEHQFDLGRRFDIVQSLEVAEHLPEHSSRDFIKSLVSHADIVLFSAAPKGQGGDHHINEQDYDYWRELFATHGYQAIDYVRHRVDNNTNVEPWYRYNTFLYVSPEAYQSLAPDVKAHRVAEDDILPDVSPLLYQLRKRLIRLLPVSIATALAKIKERVVTKIRSDGST